MPVKLRHNGHLEYRLTDEDLKLLESREYTLCYGEAGVEDVLLSKQLCVMQFASMLVTKRRIEEDNVEVVEGDYDTEFVWRGTGGHVETYSDNPICCSAVLTDYLIGLNDTLPDSDRQQLLAVLPHVIGTCPVSVHEEQSRTNPDELVLVETRDETDRYLELEESRADLINAIPSDASLDEKLEVVRRAAALH